MPMRAAEWTLIMAFLSSIFGTHSTRQLKTIVPIVDKIIAMEAEYKALSDAQLREKTKIFRDRLEKGETTEDILPEAFATVREAAVRVLGQTAFRVQLIGGLVLHQGRIAEMKTGEGKTLTATFPCYVNALTGNGVHVVTVNDYLAKYQSEWMGKVYRFLGLTVGLIVHGITQEERKAAYKADITYGTNNEYGFDYLRDNMALYKEDMVQRGHAFAIVDEVDSILIDEARTPLIISGQGDKSTDLYMRADAVAIRLKVHRIAEMDSKAEYDDVEADYIVDEKARNATLTPQGVKKVEAAFGIENLSDPENTTISHHMNQAIRARGVMQKDVDYVVKDGEVIIVDEFTGRLMIGRRYSEGLHQAIEAKEKVKVERESKTLATITFQNYFRLYKKLSGMTGTALTEEEEFNQIYKLDIIEIPTNKPVVRADYPDSVYRTVAGKYRAIINQVKECNAKGQPVLVGTISIERSEMLSAMLKKDGIKHTVLNAKHHEKEADIVAQAGHFAAVTIATNMAGRGTDIMLGGNAEFLAKAELRKSGVPEEIINEATGYVETDNEEILTARAKFSELLKKYKLSIAEEAERVKKAGGLYIIGTERHESRRIDNQLRGRSGRQGDPGASKFYISLEDDLMRLFAGDRLERLSGMLDRLGLDEDTPIDQKILSGAIENAQKRVESRNFQSRKHVLEYDDVMNRQREIIYGQRKKVLDGENLRTHINGMVDAVCEDTVKRVAGEENDLTISQVSEVLAMIDGVLIDPGSRLERPDAGDFYSSTGLVEWIRNAADVRYARREQEFGDELMREIERVMMLRCVDAKWTDHIDAMHELRQGIGLRAFAQTDPIVEYRREGFAMFEEMIQSIRNDTVRMVFTAKVRGETAPKREAVAKGITENLGGDTSVKKVPVRKTSAEKVGRNDPCPCGSGKKYKKCCGIGK